MEILNELGENMPANQQGFVALKRPLPPSCLPTVWRNHDRFESGYLAQFPGYYVSGDGGYLDDDGYLFIMGRIDDVINVAGIDYRQARWKRLSARIRLSRNVR